MIFKNIKTSLRNLKNNKVHSFLGVFGFSAGFTICLIIGLYVYGEYTADTYPEKHKQIYRIVNATTNNAELDYKLNETLNSKYPTIENSCPIYIETHRDVDVYTQHKSVYLKGLIASTNDIFELLSIPVLKSSSSNPFKDKNSSVITESAAKLIFGDNDPLGKTLQIHSYMKTVVSAVVKDLPKNSSIKGVIFLNAENPEFRLNSTAINEEITSLTNHYILLKQGASPDKLTRLINKSIGDYHKEIEEISLQALSDIYLNTEIKDEKIHGNKNLTIILSVIGVLILLLSIVNYINYILSLQYRRIKEIGIKRVHGAKNRHIISSYLTDTFLWLLISFIISLVLLKSLLPFFSQLFQEPLAFETLYTLPFVIGILSTLTTVLLISSIPLIIVLIKFDIQAFLKKKTSSNTKSISSSFLPIFQLATTMLLIIGTIIIQNQLSYAKHKDLGFNDQLLLHIKVPYKALDPIQFKDELLKYSYIEDVSLSGGIPSNIYSRMTSKKWDYTLYKMDIDEDFLKTMQIPLLKGRNVASSDKNQCIVNEATLKALGFESFEGKRIKYMYYDLEIVGLVKDFHFGSIHQKTQPILMKYALNRDVSLRISGNNISKTMKYIYKTWDKMTSDVPFKYEFYDDTFNAMYQKEEKLAYACSLFSIIAIIITCLGLLGQVLFLTDKKTKEIGIRKVNGATIKEIMFMLNKDFIKWVAIAFVIACPIAYYIMSKWLENFAYKTSLSWWVFALAGLFTLGITLLTVSWQSWRAATKNPVEALRDE
ncbi:MAG: hypothetical protein COB98_04435 [Flavobacteriaceae bacterium]|nr:MAG: hypothetical protein COB98_04435 [Flavobacteriaceae bacterium]